ncbi:Mov34/MPN/PAD-1 family protein [Enterovibrio sp. FF113]|uniref:Mov34/MPN/PAD-1 family protein n=1 Tax=Enterovibrio sp. FF113 TaxID=3230010 RepID=UPI00352E62FB
MSQCDIELVYEVEGSNGTRFVVIEPLAINAMRSLRQISPTAFEAGGVLIGERRGESFVVKEITIPSPEDRASRFHFIRQCSHHQLAIVGVNRRSGGTSNYLGEWHTHPQDQPYPSSIDFKNWRSSLRDQKPCLVAVVGRGGDWWALHENGKFHNLVSLSTFS